MVAKAAPKPRKQPVLNARASGPFGNSPRALRSDELAPYGLTVVRTLVTKPAIVKGRYTAPVTQYEGVVATEDLPAGLAPRLPERPPKRCKGCHFTRFRPDSGTRSYWVCARCHPPIGGC